MDLELVVKFFMANMISRTLSRFLMYVSGGGIFRLVTRILLYDVSEVSWFLARKSACNLLS